MFGHMVWFLGHFCIRFFTDKDYYIITNIKVNFGDLYTLHKTIYYIDTSVLLENISLVTGTPVVYFP